MTIAQDKAKIQELTEQWRKVWSPEDKPFTGNGLENVFATGKDEILVFDNYGGSVVVLRSLQEYLDTWVPVMADFVYWNVALENNLQVSIDGDLATTTFSFAGGGRNKDGEQVTLKQYCTHMWKRLNGEWRLVHEHLTSA